MAGRRRINMVGETHGKLTVVEYAGRDHHNHTLWTCVCECGGRKVVTRTNLVKGATTSCGCMTLRGQKNKRLNNLLGKTFGSLTVLAKGHSKGYRDFWLCRCACGEKVSLRDDRIKRRGDCGCGIEQKARETA